MTNHIIIDVGSLSGSGRVPGCAVCGISEKICIEYPNCRGETSMYSIASHDQKTFHRRRKRKKK